MHNAGDRVRSLVWEQLSPSVTTTEPVTLEPGGHNY